MYMKHDKFSEVELDIINRGKDCDIDMFRRNEFLLSLFKYF